MGIGSIGSTPSFYQQDQSYWSDQQSAASSASASDTLINAMGNAMVTKAKGLASIANGQALTRVNSQLVAAIQSLLTGNSTSAGSTSSTGSSSSTAAKPATATGTALLTTSTPLSLLGIPAGGAINISAGSNTTTYASTGSDTVGDLMNAINADYYGNAQVTASLNSHGALVLTAKNTTDTITVGDLYASNIGFGVGNNTFEPTAGTTSSSTASSASTASTATTSTTTTSTASAKQSYTTLASETASSAASLLSASGASGSLVDMLA
jgi:hypothetical protein